MNWEKISRKTINIGLCLIAGLVSLGFGDPPVVWQKSWGHLVSAEVRKILRDEGAGGGFWLVTANALYHLDRDQRSTFVLNKEVHDIFQDPEDTDTAYIAAEDGIYKLENRGLRRILSRHGCLAVVAVNGKIFAGTHRGLLIGDGSQNSWGYSKGTLAQRPVLSLVSFGNVIYVVTPTALYRYEAASNDYKEIFSTGVSNEMETEDQPSEEGTSEIKPEILDIDVADDGSIYVSTQNGIYFSRNWTGQWQRLPDEGLPLRSLNAVSLEQNGSRIWAASGDGVYHFTERRWEKFDQGLETNAVYDLAHGPSGELYATTDRGIFYLEAAKVFARDNSGDNVRPYPKIFKRYADIEEYFQNEPTVREVQDMAIQYADVHPEKIKRWHRQSRLKALVPSLSTGLDRSATDLMHWDTGGNPDNLLKGRDFLEWDVSLSWDLGDLVWSSDQTSIDSRSKLMTELREEVLDQVTRIYFERRRTQMTILARAEDGLDNLDEHMRLSELTAILDGFTGGQFNLRIKGHGDLS